MRPRVLVTRETLDPACFLCMRDLKGFHVRPRGLMTRETLDRVLAFCACEAIEPVLAFCACEPKSHDS